MTEEYPRRRTVEKTARLEGNGIHTNAPAVLQIRPAEPGSGLLWRMNGTGQEDLPAIAANAVSEQSERRTVLRGSNGTVVQQTEHVLAALAAHGITDALLVQDGPEPPFLGGGAFEFMEAIAEAGVRDLEQEIEPFIVNEPYEMEWEGARLLALPDDCLRLSCFVEFPGTAVGSMGVTCEITPERFRDEISRARTFALESDLDKLWQAGLAKGGSLKNAVVFNQTGYLNESLFHDDEVVRHKIIDLLGDLALLGRPARGHFWAWKAGHRHHVRFVQRLVEDQERQG